MIYNPSGVGQIELNTIILDLNGTLAVGGKVPAGVKERVQKLKDQGFKIYLFSFDQRGQAAGIVADLGIDLRRTKDMADKEKETLQLEVGKTVAIGNARIDIGTFKSTRVRIATLQSEGIHAAILPFVDIIVPTINDAFDLLLDVNTFNATMRV